MDTHADDERGDALSPSPASPCCNHESESSGLGESAAEGTGAEIRQPNSGGAIANVVPSTRGPSSGRGVIRDAMRLLGQGVGLTHRISAKTADGVVSASRRTGTFLTAPLKRRQRPTNETREERAAMPGPENESHSAGIKATRRSIEARTCRSTKLDQESLLRGLEQDVSDADANDKAEGITVLAIRSADNAGEPTDRSESAQAPAASEEKGEERPSAEERQRVGLERELAKVRGTLYQAEQLNARIHSNENNLRERLHEQAEGLAAVTRDLEEARDRADDERSRHAEELDSFQSKFESLQLQLTAANTAADEARSRAEALESDLASARDELDAVRNQAQEEQARLSSLLDAVQSEKDSLQSDLVSARSQAEDAISQVDHLEAELLASSESSGEWEEGPLQPELQLADPQDHMPLEEATDPPSDQASPDQPAPELDIQADDEELATPTAEQDVLVSAGITAAEVQAASFSGASERVIFTRALSDMDLTHKPDTTRARAVRRMGGIRHPLSARSLTAQLHHDESASVRQECIRALTALEATDSLPVIRCALKDEVASVRLAAVRAVYRLASLEGVGDLVQMLHDEDEDIKRRAATCLGWLGHKPVAPELAKLLKDGSAAVRLAGLEALENLKSSAVVPEIIELLDDAEEPVQRRAFHALATITGKRMGESFPEDENGRTFMIARWRAHLATLPRRAKPDLLQSSA